MNSDFRHLETVSFVERTISRPLAAFVLSLLPAMLLVTAIALAKPELTAEEIGVAAAVPILALYLMIRVFTAFAKPLTKAEMESLDLGITRIPVIFRRLVDTQAIAAIGGIVAIASALVFWWVGMSWAWTWSLEFGVALIGLSIVAALVCGGLIMAAESHASGGVVRSCHAMMEIVWYRLMSWSGNMRDLFENNSGIRPVSR